MSQGQGAFHRPGNPRVHLRDLNPGDRVKTSRGATAEVVMNPRDGLWVLVSYVEAPPDGPESVGDEDMLYFEDVGGLA